MASQQSNGFQRIDAALAQYYQNLGYSDYINPQTGIGRFMQYIIDEELNDEDLPIDRELGDNCDPNDCAYSWMNNDTEFPIPSYVNITNNQQKEAFIFYVLQYCYKHGQHPSDQYIRSTLVPQSGATVRVNAIVPYCNNQQAEPSILVSQNSQLRMNDNQSPPFITKQDSIYTQPQRPPVPFSQGAMFDITAFGGDSSMTNKSNHVYTKQLTQANLLKLPAIDDLIESKTVEPFDENAEGVPQIVNHDESTIVPEIFRIADIEFKPKYPARAHLNIFTAKELTKKLREIINEEFENDLILYYYTDISTALQINDKQMREFTFRCAGNDGNQNTFEHTNDDEKRGAALNNKIKRLSIINYDLHLKGSDAEFLYGIIVPNDNYKIQQDKWLWKLDDFLTADAIERKFKIKRRELPKSSRQMPAFLRQLQQKLVIEESLIDNTDWFTVQQIKSLKRNVKVPKVTITLNKEMWITECKKSFQNVELPLIPVVVNKNNQHWIEWIKIIHIQSQNVYVGISCKFDESQGTQGGDISNRWSVQSICLDRGDIYNKHRLVGLNRDRYNVQLENFKTSITEIKFSDNESKDIDKKINVLKQQIRSQQDSIVRLKESLLRAKNANKYVSHTNDIDEMKENDIQSMQIHIKEFIDEPEDDVMSGGLNGEAWLDQLVDDVIKKYEVMDFKTTPIGAKRNIYIDKQFTKAWMNYVSPKFNDEAMMYYWLDYTTAMQMCQGYSKQYINNQTRKFMVAVINYELRDINNNILFGIIVCDDDKIEKKNDKYPYKLKTLMTKEQIRNEYGINTSDLPKKSRKNQDFINKLLLKRRIVKQDLNKINWSNLKLFKSQSTNNDPINKSVTITQKVMKEYCNIALERLNASNQKNNNGNNNNNNLIPIVVIDKHHNYYGIEWVLIVHIIHRNCDVGISFRYDIKTNTFIATAIYLDKGEIESKHKLIGLKFDYCKHLRPFSLRKFKFKSDRHSIIDDDDDIALPGSVSSQITPHQVHQINQLKNEVITYKKAFEAEQLRSRHLQQSMQHNAQMYITEINQLKQQNQAFVAQQQNMMIAAEQQQAHQNVIYAQNQVPQAPNGGYAQNNGSNYYQPYNGF